MTWRRLDAIERRRRYLAALARITRSTAGPT